MYSWSRPLSGSRSHRRRVVTRRRLEGLAYIALIFIPLLGYAGVDISAQLAIVMGAFVFLPLLLLAVMPRVRCALSDATHRVVSLCVFDEAQPGRLPQDAAEQLGMEVRVTFVCVADRFAQVVAALSARLHGVVHHCALRARLTSAIGAGC